MTRGASFGAPAIGGKGTTANLDVVRCGLASPAGIRTSVLPSTDSPTGVGSSPILGSAHAPSIVIDVPSPPPGWMTRSPTVVEAPSGATVVIASEPQAGPVGVPSGRTAITSP